MKPLRTSGCVMRSRIIPRTVASSTSLPASIAALAFCPSARRPAHGLAQQIAGRYLRRAVRLHEPLRLRALAGPGRAQKNYSHDSPRLKAR